MADDLLSKAIEAAWAELEQQQAEDGDPYADRARDVVDGHPDITAVVKAVMRAVGLGKAADGGN